jgi:hypothetical protein
MTHFPRKVGTRSLIASVESQLGGRTLFDWRPEGLFFQLSVPVIRKEVELDDEPVSRKPEWVIPAADM